MGLKKRQIVYISLFIVAVVLFFPTRYAVRYSYVPTDTIWNELVKAPGVWGHNLSLCQYDNLILENEEIDIEEVFNAKTFQTPLPGGEYFPKDCNPVFKTAIIVPYRNRTEHLRTFLNYMHWFLQKQKIHYQIFVADQNDNKPFNRAKMLNAGASEAIRQNYKCLILHDVDLIPLTLGNIYACSKRPRHMSCSLDTFRFNLPYLGLSGGTVSIQTSQFQLVNGMSNLFDGWGGEDDDFFNRLSTKGIIPYRFAPAYSKYTMLTHKKASPSADRYNMLHAVKGRHEYDGLNTLKKDLIFVKKDLYTHVLV